MELIVAIILLSLLGSFICSLCEASLYAITPTQVEFLRQQGGGRGLLLAKLRSQIDDAIAAILTINTITQTVGVAWAGALIGERYGAYWLGVFASVFTIGYLLLTEIVPKSVGVAWANVLAVRLAWIIQFMIWTVWPLAKLSTFIMRTITHRAPGDVPREEEIMVMAELAAKRGAILRQESRWVKNVLRLNDVAVRQLMTPRHVVFSLPANLSLEKLEPHAEHWLHSRVPVTEGSGFDRVVGVVERRRVFDALVREELQATLRDLMGPAVFVRENQLGHQLLETLIDRRQHLAVVVDGEGKPTGVVTLEDVLECLLGRPIVEEHDDHPEMKRLERERVRFQQEQTKREDGE